MAIGTEATREEMEKEISMLVLRDVPILEYTRYGKMFVSILKKRLQIFTSNIKMFRHFTGMGTEDIMFLLFHTVRSPFLMRSIYKIAIDYLSSERERKTIVKILEGGETVTSSLPKNDLLYAFIQVKKGVFYDVKRIKNLQDISEKISSLPISMRNYSYNVHTELRRFIHEVETSMEANLKTFNNDVEKATQMRWRDRAKLLRFKQMLDMVLGDSGGGGGNIAATTNEADFERSLILLRRIRTEYEVKVVRKRFESFDAFVKDLYRKLSGLTITTSDIVMAENIATEMEESFKNRYDLERSAIASSDMVRACLSTIQGLSAELKDLRKWYNQFADLIPIRLPGIVEERVTNLERFLNERAEFNENLKEENIALKTEVNILRVNTDKLQTRLNECVTKAKTDETEKKEIDKLKTYINDLQGNNETLKREVEILRVNNKNQQDYFDSLLKSERDKVEKLNEDLEYYKRQYRVSTATDKKTDLSDNEKTLYLQEIDKLKTYINNLQGDNEKLQQNNRSAIEQLQKTITEYQSLINNNEALEEKITIINSRYEQLDKGYKTNSEELQKTITELNKCTTANQSLTNNNEALKKEIKKCEDALQAMRTNVGADKLQRDNIQRLTDENKRLNARLEEYRQQSVNIKFSHDQTIKETKDVYTKQVDTLKRDLESMRKKYDELIDVCMNKNSEIGGVLKDEYEKVKVQRDYYKDITEKLQPIVHNPKSVVENEREQLKVDRQPLLSLIFEPTDQPQNYSSKIINTVYLPQLVDDEKPEHIINALLLKYLFVNILKKRHLFEQYHLQWKKKSLRETISLVIMYMELDNNDRSNADFIDRIVADSYMFPHLQYSVHLDKNEDFISLKKRIYSVMTKARDFDVDKYLGDSVDQSKQLCFIMAYINKYFPPTALTTRNEEFDKILKLSKPDVERLFNEEKKKVKEKIINLFKYNKFIKFISSLAEEQTSGSSSGSDGDKWLWYLVNNFFIGPVDVRAIQPHEILTIDHYRVKFEPL